MRKGLFWILSIVVLQSCASFSVLPKNISNHSSIEGIYSNLTVIDTFNIIDTTSIAGATIWANENYLQSELRKYADSFWSKIDYKHEIKTNNIVVKVEIINSKKLQFSFVKNGEIIGTKKLKGRFKKDECFYTRRQFLILPLFPLVVGYYNYQDRIYRVDNELIFEEVGNNGGVCLFFAGGDNYNRISRFKQLDNLHNEKLSQ